MPRRVARLLFRAAGWLLTPLVLISAAAIGATIGLIIAPTFPPGAALGLTAGTSLIGAIAGLVLWMRMLREHPGLRHTLEMTVEGVPESPLVQRLIHPEGSEPDGPS